MIKSLLSRSLLPAALGLLLINQASAQLLKTGPSVFNYNFGDLAYVDDDIADGFGLRFSADIRENYALQVAYRRLSAGSLDVDAITGSVAYHIESSRFRGKADWVFDVGIDIIDAESIDETGLNAGAGIRYAITDACLLYTSDAADE